MPPGQQNWLFPKENLEHTPSRKDGMSAESERAVRKSICTFIQRVGTHIHGGHGSCKPMSMNTAKVFFHRVCMSQSVATGKQNPKLLGVTCLFVACKTEEDMRPIKEYIWAMNQIDVDENGQNLYPYGTTTDETIMPKGRKRHKWMVDEESVKFQQVRENMLQVEKCIMQMLDYDFSVRHPISFTKEIIQFLDARRKRNEDNTDFDEKRRLVQGDGSVLSELGVQIYNMAYAMANDSGSTTLALEYDAAVIAAGCVSLAVKASTKANPFKLIKVSKWTKELVAHFGSKKDPAMYPKEVAEQLKKDCIEDVQNQMLDLYDEAEMTKTSVQNQQIVAEPEPPAAPPAHASSSSDPAGHTTTTTTALPATRPAAPVAPGGGSSHSNGSHKPSGHGSAAPAGPTQPAAAGRAQDLADLEAGKTVSMKGSGPKPHELVFSKETNVYKCTCPVWRNVPLRENDKTCRHLIMIRSRNTEMGRVGEEGIAKMEKAEEVLRQQYPQARPSSGGGGGGGQRPRGDGKNGDYDAAKRPRTGP